MLKLVHTAAPGPRLVVTGSRRGRTDVCDALDRWVAIFGVPTALVLGGEPPAARGVDRAAWEWHEAYTRHRRPHWGFARLVERPKWGLHGRDAGPERNERMVKRCDVGDHLLAFPDPEYSPGTWHCYGFGRAQGLLCAVVGRGPWLENLRLQHSQHPRWKVAG